MMDEYDYSGERFLYKIYPKLKDSEEVKYKTDNTDSIQNIKKYMDRLERIHETSVKRNKLSRLLKFYYKKYVIKPEDIDANSLHGATVDDIISEQKRTLSSWISYFTSPGANYPVWAKYWAFQGMLKMGTFNEATGIYNKRTNKTLTSFVDCNSELVAKAIELIIKYNHGQSLDDKDVEKLVQTGSFSKVYGRLLHNYKETKSIQSDPKDGIWIKYNQGSVEDAKKLCASLQDKGTGWCTASEKMAIDQVCGRSVYEGGDFYVYYTKDEQGKYTMPRIAIRMEAKNSIGEIRGVSESQNLEDGLEIIVEEKLNNIPNLKIDDKNEALNTCEDLKKLSVISKKTHNGEILTQEESILLFYDGDKIGFGWEEDPRVERIIAERKNKKLIYSDFEILDFEASKLILTYDYELFQYVPTDLEGYKKICIEAIEYTYNALEYVPQEYIIKNRKEFIEIALAAIKRQGYSLKNVPNELKNEEMCRYAIKRHKIELRYVPSDKQWSKNICVEAVQENWRLLQYVPEKLKDKEMCLDAVRCNFKALRYIPKDKEWSKDICIEEVKQNFNAIRYVKEDIQGYKDICIEAVKQNVYALQYIPTDIEGYNDICIEAVNNFNEVQYISVPDDLMDLINKIRENNKNIENNVKILKKEK